MFTMESPIALDWGLNVMIYFNNLAALQCDCRYSIREYTFLISIFVGMCYDFEVLRL